MQLSLFFKKKAFTLQSNYEMTKWQSLQAFYRALLGDFGSMNSMVSDLDILSWIIFLCMSLLMMIIMLNLLIAIISDTYDKVMGVEKLANAYEKTNIIVDIEKTLPRTIITQIEKKINDYLVVAYTKPNSRADGDGGSGGGVFLDRMRSKVERIERKVSSLEESLERGFDRINRKDKYLLEYLEKNFERFYDKVDDARKIF